MYNIVHIFRLLKYKLGHINLETGAEVFSVIFSSL